MICTISQALIACDNPFSSGVSDEEKLISTWYWVSGDQEIAEAHMTISRDGIFIIEGTSVGQWSIGRRGAWRIVDKELILTVFLTEGGIERRVATYSFDEDRLKLVQEDGTIQIWRRQ